MLKVKKSTRILLAFVLTMAMVFSLATTVSAAGVENWGYGAHTSSPFNIWGYNLTPTKTLTQPGVLSAGGWFTLTDTAQYPNPAICTIQIRTTNGTVLAEATALTNSNHECNQLVTHAYNLPANQQVQIFMSVYDSVTHVARHATVYYACFLNDN